MPKLTKEYLSTLTQEQQFKAIVKEYAKCRKNPQYCIETYFTVVGRTGERVSFELYPHQIDALDSYLKYNNNISLKTRQMGFTTFTAAFILFMMIFNNNYLVDIISKTQKDAIKFVKDIKGIAYEVIKNYPWLLRSMNETQMRVELPNNSIVYGESTTEDAGRGNTYDLVVVDEVAFIDRKSANKMNEIWSAVGPALTKRKGRSIMISTPKGTSGWYYNTYTNASSMGFHVIDAHWIKHPDFSAGAYRWVPDSEDPNGGKIEYLNKTWPEKIFNKETGTFKEVKKSEYAFILDGKIRSPWYDFESARLGPQRTKCELDCSFMGTGGEVLDTDILRDLQLFVDEKGMYTQPLGHINGIFKLYKEYKSPIEGRRYVLSADVSTGDGSDFSAVTILDVETLEVVGTFKGQIIPDTFGKLIHVLGKRFNNCVVVVENAGGGGTTLQTLKVDGYPNIYYSTLRKNDPSTGMKKRKLGLWPSEQVRWEGGDRLEEVIRNKKLSFYCNDIMTELYTWIWDKDGKRRHAPEKHDDLLMALQHGVYYIYYVIRRSDRNRNVFQAVFERRVDNDILKLTTENPELLNKNQIERTSTQRPNISKYNKYRQNSINIDSATGEEFIQNLKRSPFL